MLRGGPARWAAAGRKTFTPRRARDADGGGDEPPDTPARAHARGVRSPMLEIDGPDRARRPGAAPVLNGVTLRRPPRRDRRHRRRLGQRAGASSSRCWPGQREPRGGQSSASAASAYRRTRARACATRKVRCLPEAPLRNACVAKHVRGREPGLPRASIGRPFTRAGWLVSRRALRKHARALIEELQDPHAGPRRADRHSVGRQRAARRARARAVSDVSLLIAANPCFGLDFAAVARDPHAASCKRATAAPRCCW